MSGRCQQHSGHGDGNGNAAVENFINELHTENGESFNAVFALTAAVVLWGVVRKMESYGGPYFLCWKPTTQKISYKAQLHELRGLYVQWKSPSCPTGRECMSRNSIYDVITVSAYL